LAEVIKSGWTPITAFAANKAPIRSNPDTTSSATWSMPWSRQISRVSCT
jgi:hypothetical protein